jgi:hypothetical protein
MLVDNLVGGLQLPGLQCAVSTRWRHHGGAGVGCTYAQMEHAACSPDAGWQAGRRVGIQRCSVEAACLCQQRNLWCLRVPSPIFSYLIALYSSLPTWPFLPPFITQVPCRWGRHRAKSIHAVIHPSCGSQSVILRRVRRRRQVPGEGTR